MIKVYACLLGNWVCLNDDPDCRIDDRKGAYLWWEEGAPVFAPTVRDKEYENSFYGLDYVRISYFGQSYRISPQYIQILGE